MRVSWQQESKFGTVELRWSVVVGTGMCGRSTHAGFFVGSSHFIIRIHCFTIFSGHTVKIGHIVSARSHITYVIALVSQIRNWFSVSLDFFEHEAGWQKKKQSSKTGKENKREIQRNRGKRNA